MRRFIVIGGLIAAGCLSLTRAQSIAGDASRGAALLDDLGCPGCHRLRGQGTAAVDLGTRVSRGYTPAYLAGVLWNHRFKGAVGTGGLVLNEDQALDLFAYFASRRFFELPGDAGRGKRVFAGRSCLRCHEASLEGKPAAQWPHPRDPIAFAQAAWNHSQAMRRALAARQVPYPHLDPQELNDLTVYLDNLPATRKKEPRFLLVPAETGRALFETKGCAGCHHGKLSLEDRLSDSTINSVVAALWNHPPAPGEGHTMLSYDETSALVGFLWSLEKRGNRHRGGRVFGAKKCVVCHDEDGARLQASERSIRYHREAIPVKVLATLGRPGADMQEEMSRLGMRWPRFTGSEMANLVTYLEVAESRR